MKSLFNIQVFIVLILYVFPAALLFANDSVKLSGKVFSKNDATPIPYALILVKHSDSLRTRADEEGLFQLILPKPGKYWIKASIKGDLIGESPWVEVDMEGVSSQHPRETALEIALASSDSDIIVTGIKPNRNPSENKITQVEMNRVSGTAGDPMWALLSLPGITGNEGNAEPVVRGAFPGDNLYYIDDLPVGYLFHANGAISAIDGKYIQDITFLPSAYGAEYGDKLGGVFEFKTIDPLSDRWLRSIGFSLLGFSFGAQGPVSKNQSMLFNARRSYLDIVIKLVEFEEENSSEFLSPPRYDDVQFKYDWEVNSNNKVSFQLIGARDYARTNLNPGGVLQIEEIDDAYFTQGIIWDSYFKKISSKMIAGYLYKETFSNDSDIEIKERGIRNIFFREKLRFQLHKNHLIKMGGDLSTQRTHFSSILRYTCNQEVRCVGAVDVTPRINYGAAYFNDSWQVADNVIVDLGARLSGNDLIKRFYLEPRLGASWQVLRRTKLTAGWGRYNQPPGLDSVYGLFSRPALVHRRADHYLAGILHEFNSQWSWKTELYYKTFWDFLEWDFNQGLATNDTTGEAYGAEILIKKNLSHDWSGWLSLTASRAEFKNAFFDNTRLSDFDRPLIAVFVLSKHLSNDWMFSLKWNYHTGDVYTPIIGSTPIIDEDTGETVFYQAQYGAANSARFPHYHALDLRLSKHFKYSTWELETYFELINAYNRKNVKKYVYSFDKRSRKAEYHLPIFPSVGFTAHF